MKPIKTLIFLLICLLTFTMAKADYTNGKGKGHGYGHYKNKHAKKEGKKVPIDGGISLLIAAGAALGAKKLYNRTHKNIPGA